MKTLNWMLVKSFLLTFVFALTFFVLALQMVDLFTNIFKYMDKSVPIKDIGLIALYYIPKCISFALPLALLFAVSYTLGTLYANNELISIFGAGVSLFRFVLPLIILGILLSFANFWFEENIVITNLYKKNQLSDEALKLTESTSNTNVYVISYNNHIYSANYYHGQNKTFNGVTIIERDNGSFVRKIQATTATWNEQGQYWLFNECRIFEWDDETEFLVERYEKVYSDPTHLNELPSTFERINVEMEDMNVVEAQALIERLNRSGLNEDYRKAQTDYYGRFAFALTPFIVILVSGSIGGRFKKNILLMSLLISLVVSVLYYVLDLVLNLVAYGGAISPLAGAWGSFFVFTVLGFWMFSQAKT